MRCVNCSNCNNKFSCSIFSKRSYFPEFCSDYQSLPFSLLSDYIFIDDSLLPSFKELVELGFE